MKAGIARKRRTTKILQTVSAESVMQDNRLSFATEFTTPALDGYGLRDHWLARPPRQGSHLVLVHRVAALLHASFRPRLAT